MASSPLSGSLLRSVPLHRSTAAAAASATGGVSRRSFQAGYIENADEFEKRLFGNNGNGNEGSLYSNLDRVENANRRHGYGRGGFGGFGDRSNSGAMGGFDSLNDGMNQALGDAARNFQADDHEEEDWDEEEFEFRPDVHYRRGSTYKPQDLDVTRPAAARNPPRPQFETTTKEVLRKADFRNVRFLSNFLTEAGIMIKRSQTRISAKAQRKVAREIKTARAFGLMPFTTMGRRPFIFGRTAEEHHSEEEFGYDFVDQKDGEPAVDVEDAEPIWNVV